MYFLMAVAELKRVFTAYLASFHQQYVVFQIKTPWRPKVKKIVYMYGSFINLA